MKQPAYLYWPGRSVVLTLEVPPPPPAAEGVADAPLLLEVDDADEGLTDSEAEKEADSLAENELDELEESEAETDGEPDGAEDADELDDSMGADNDGEPDSTGAEEELEDSEGTETDGELDGADELVAVDVPVIAAYSYMLMPFPPPQI